LPEGGDPPGPERLLLNAGSSGLDKEKTVSRMIFIPDRRTKIIPPASFSLSIRTIRQFVNQL
jgi:hypothetical protein